MNFSHIEVQGRVFAGDIERVVEGAFLEALKSSASEMEGTSRCWLASTLTARMGAG